MWKVLIKDVDLGGPTSFLDHVYLGCTQRECQTSKDIETVTDFCLNPKSLLELAKSYLTLRNLAHTFPHGPIIWQVTRRIALNDVMNWQQNNSTTIQSRNTVHWRPPIQGRRNGLSETCQRFADKLFQNSCIWPALVDLIFYGLKTNLLVLSLSGPEHVTNAQHVWSHTLITHVNSNNIVMCEIQHNNAD